MSVIFGVIGQVSFLGPAFGGRWWSYAGAVALGGYLEASMVSAGQRSLKHRELQHDEGKKSWVLMLLVGLAISIYAAASNIGHFWSTNPSMALMVGGASLWGFVLHMITSHIELGAEMRRADANKDAQDQARKRAERRAEQRERDADKRDQEEHQARLAAIRAQATPDAAPAAATKHATQQTATKAEAPHTSTKAPAQPAAETPVDDELAKRRGAHQTDLVRRVNQWSRANQVDGKGPGPVAIRRHWEDNFPDEAKHLPSNRTLQRWANGGGSDLADAK